MMIVIQMHPEKCVLGCVQEFTVYHFILVVHRVLNKDKMISRYTWAKFLDAALYDTFV